MMRLLDKNEWTRLGSKSGASEVKQHRWFSKINWGLLRNTQPPVRVFVFDILTLTCSARPHCFFMMLIATSVSHFRSVGGELPAMGFVASFGLPGGGGLLASIRDRVLLQKGLVAVTLG